MSLELEKNVVLHVKLSHLIGLVLVTVISTKIYQDYQTTQTLLQQINEMNNRLTIYEVQLNNLALENTYLKEQITQLRDKNLSVAQKENYANITKSALYIAGGALVYFAIIKFLPQLSLINLFVPKRLVEWAQDSIPWFRDTKHFYSHDSLNNLNFTADIINNRQLKLLVNDPSIHGSNQTVTINSYITMLKNLILQSNNAVQNSVNIRADSVVDRVPEALNFVSLAPTANVNSGTSLVQFGTQMANTAAIEVATAAPATITTDILINHIL